MSGELSIGELVGTISLNDVFSGPINNVAKAVGLGGESFKAITGFVGLAGAAIATTTAAIVALGVQGGKVDTMERSFNSLASSVNVTGDAMLGSLRTATQGLISDMDLMAASNKAVLLGLPVTAASMGTMAEAATVLGRAMGQDATKSLDDLTTALGRSSPLILDNLGLSVKVGEANEAYARSLGKTAEQLTEGEKKQAFYNAAMDAAQKKVAELGGVHLTFADRVQQGRTMVTNFVNDLGKAIATSPVVAAGLDSIMASMQGAFGGTQQDTVKTLMGFVNKFAIGLTYVGQGAVTTASVFVTAWAAIELAVLSVLTVISAVGTGLVSLVAGLAQLAAEIPGAAKLVDGFAAGATQLALSMDEVTTGLSEQAAEANRALAGNSALQQTLDGMSGAFITAREAMEAAAGAQAVLADGAPVVKKGLDDTAAAASLTAAQIKAIEDATRKGQEALFDMAAEGAAQMQQLQDDMTAANLAGVDARLFEVMRARDAEIAGLQGLALEYPVMYENLVTLVTEKYQQMTDAAIEANTAQIAAASAKGFTEQEIAAQTLAEAIANYNMLVLSATSSYSQIGAAYAAMMAAQDRVTEMSNAAKMRGLEQIAGAVSGLLTQAFGKNKAAAIAAAVIDTAAAVVKALASAPPPLNYVLAATVGAMGLVEINKIRSTNAGFATGTQGTAFQDFGRESTVNLHGQEAVVTKHQGASLADMVVGAVRDRDNAVVTELRAMRADAERDRDALPMRLQAAIAFGNA